MAASQPVAADLPVNCVELAKLTELDISTDTLRKFGDVTLSSYRFLCAKQNFNGQPTATIVDLRPGSGAPPQVSRTTILSQVNSVLNHPSSKILALRSGSWLQVFETDTRNRLNTTSLDNVLFWKWVNNNTIGIVTNTAVYHWNKQDGEVLQKFCDVGSKVKDCRILNYDVSTDGQWSCLVGAAPPAAGTKLISGRAQLFSKNRKMSQGIDAHATCFGRFGGNTIFAFAIRDGDGNGKLRIFTLGTSKKRSCPVYYAPDAPDDFPVGLEFSEKYGVVFMVTKHGYISAYEVETATPLGVIRTGDPSITFTTAATPEGGIVLVNQTGQVLSVELDETKLVSHCHNVLQDSQLAQLILARLKPDKLPQEFVSKDAFLAQQRVDLEKFDALLNDERKKLEEQLGKRREDFLAQQKEDLEAFLHTGASALQQSDLLSMEGTTGSSMDKAEPNMAAGSSLAPTPEHSTQPEAPLMVFPDQTEAAPATQAPAAPQDPLAVPPDAIPQYTAIYDQTPKEADGTVSGVTARNLFTRTGLGVNILAKIWSLSDMDQDNFLNKTEFMLATHLINLAKKNIELPETVPASVLASLRGGSGVGVSTPMMSARDQVLDVLKKKFETIGTSRPGFVSGVEARDALLASGLNTQNLATIWGLSDRDKDSHLSFEEWTTAVLLAARVIKGMPLPATFDESQNESLLQEVKILDLQWL